MSDEKYAEWLRRELKESKRVLEKQTGQKVEYLAYPYGDYDDRVARTAVKAGYKAALTCDFGRVKRGSDPLRMRRFVIDDQMDFAAFRKYLGATPLRLAEMTPQPGKPVEPGVTAVSAKIPAHESLDPTSVGMALLSAGATVPYSYDARTGEISLVLQDAISNLTAKYHRAVVWADDLKTGKRVEATWVFRMGEPPQPEQALPAVTAVRTGAAPGLATTGGSPRK
jgi:peptidoglycan/xylan/chitin deacetylase (PgdA/CDA1 family)